MPLRMVDMDKARTQPSGQVTATLTLYLSPPPLPQQQLHRASWSILRLFTLHVRKAMTACHVTNYHRTSYGVSRVVHGKSKVVSSPKVVDQAALTSLVISLARRLLQLEVMLWLRI